MAKPCVPFKEKPSCTGTSWNCHNVSRFDKYVSDILSADVRLRKHGEDVMCAMETMNLCNL